MPCTWPDRHPEYPMRCPAGDLATHGCGVLSGGLRDGRRPAEAEPPPTARLGRDDDPVGAGVRPAGAVERGCRSRLLRRLGRLPDRRRPLAAPPTPGSSRAQAGLGAGLGCSRPEATAGMTPLNMNLSGGTRKALDTLAERRSEEHTSEL